MALQNVIDPALISEIKKLNIEDKLAIVEDIWESISSSGQELPVSEKHKKDLDKRFKDYKVNPDDGSTWEEVRSRIESKI